MNSEEYDLVSILTTVVLLKALKEKQWKLWARAFLIKDIILLINNS